MDRAPESFGTVRRMRLPPGESIAPLRAAVEGAVAQLATRDGNLPAGPQTTTSVCGGRWRWTTVEMTARTPNLLIAGAPKCGTSSLHSYLAERPEVCAADAKELHYFTPLSWGDEPRSFEEYVSHFRSCSERRYLLEASPEYLYGGAAIATAVSTQLPDTRVIFILREPVERFYSHYRHNQKHVRVPRMSLADFVVRALEDYQRLEHDPRKLAQNPYARCLRAGRYASYLQQWHANIGASRMLVLFFDDLLADVMTLVNRVDAWLGLEPRANVPRTPGVMNQSELIRWRTLHRGARRASVFLRPLLNRHARLAGALRQVYWRVNEVDTAGWTEGREVRALRAFYAPANLALLTWLRQVGHERVPTWLRGEPPSATPEPAGGKA